jgi:BolA protein
MLSSEERKSQIHQKLTQTFAPLALDIIDDSAKHRGHSGHGGAGHFSVRIIATTFAGHTLVKRHRLVYAALQELIGPEIHALSIEARTPDEVKDYE